MFTAGLRALTIDFDDFGKSNTSIYVTYGIDSSAFCNFNTNAGPHCR